MQTVTSEVRLRPEAPEDLVAIRDLIASAFLDHPHSRQTEGQVLDALRRAGALALSLVAHRDGQVVGHVAFSPVHIAGGAQGWYCLAPLSVQPGRRGAGVGSALVWHGLRTLQQLGAAGVVVFGEPAYFGRFGFRSTPALRLTAARPDCFLVRPFHGLIPLGTVQLHAAFDLIDPSVWTFP